MAGYALSTVTTTISHNAGAYTTTTDLTVPSGHIYLLKDVSIRGNMVNTGASGAGALRWRLSDAAGANFVDAGAIIQVPAASLPLHNFDYRFAVPKAEIITALTTPMGSSYVYEQSSMLWNRSLAAGMILRFSPVDGATAAGTGWNNTTQTWNVTLSVTYIDYTI